MSAAAPWWTPPPGLRDVEGWLAAMREVEAVCGVEGEAVPRTLADFRGWDARRAQRAAMEAEELVGWLARENRARIDRQNRERTRIDTGRLRRSVELYVPSEPVGTRR